MTPLIDDALTALRAMEGAAPAAETVRAAAAAIEEAWARAWLSAGIRGDGLARAALLDLVTGGELDWSSRAPGSAAVRVRRGVQTRFHARGEGLDEVGAMPRSHDDDRARAGAAAAIDAVAAREREAARTQALVPARILRRPPPWAVWSWLARWVQMLVARRELVAWRRAITALDDARREARALTEGVAALKGRDGAERARFAERLRVLASGVAAGAKVREIELEVVDGALPAELEVLELTGWSRAGADVDGVIEVHDAGGIAALVAGLPEVLRGARALRLGRRALDAIVAATRLLDHRLADAETDFAARLARLEARAIDDPDRFVAEQLARRRAQTIASVSALMEHASVHLGAELGAPTAWTEAIHAASSSDDLAVAAATIEQEMAAASQRIADEVQLLVMGGLGGIVHDLTPLLLAPLAAHGVPADQLRAPARAPVLPPVTVLASLAEPLRSGLAAGRLATLFRSRDALQRDLLDRVDQRSTRLRARAEADMLDAEPRLRDAVEGALTVALTAAIERQRTLLDQAIADEHEAIAAARAALAPLVEARDAGRASARQLARSIEALAIAQPAAAAAADASHHA